MPFCLGPQRQRYLSVAAVSWLPCSTCRVLAVMLTCAMARTVQVGRRAHAMLLTHMQRFTYSATGALRWKRDVTEFAEVLRNSHSPTTNAQVSTLVMSVLVIYSVFSRADILWSAEATSTPQCWLESP